MTADKPFRMVLHGDKDKMLDTAARLTKDFYADVTVRSRGNRSKLVALVPQKHAKAAMEALGLP